MGTTVTSDRIPVRVAVLMPVLTYAGITLAGGAVGNVASQAADLSNTPFWTFMGLTVAAVIGYIGVTKAAKQRTNQPETPDVARRLDRMEKQAREAATAQTQVATSLAEYRQSTDQRFEAARKETREWLDEIMSELRAQRERRDR